MSKSKTKAERLVPIRQFGYIEELDNHISRGPFAGYSTAYRWQAAGHNPTTNLTEARNHAAIDRELSGTWNTRTLSKVVSYVPGTGFNHIMPTTPPRKTIHQVPPAKQVVALKDDRIVVEVDGFKLSIPSDASQKSISAVLSGIASIRKQP